MTTEDAFLQDILKDPDDTGPQRIYADWLEEQGRTEEARALREGRILCLGGCLEYPAAALLSRCRFLPGSTDKRFAGSNPLLFPNPGVATVRQWAYLWRLVWHYRQQILEGTHASVPIVRQVVARVTLLLDKEPSSPRWPRPTLDAVETLDSLRLAYLEADMRQDLQGEAETP